MQDFVHNLALVMTGSAILTTVFAILVRFAWRRGKNLNEP